ncbi:hypothetical protein FQN49_007112 [Arthroderma sp. PD_2]|nr:hypothetical protein FQN49_007112 [Arthroderma sp. PD_2]
MVRLVITRVNDSDWDQLVEVQFKAFAAEQFCQFVNGKDTPLNRERCKKKYTSHEPEKWGGALWLKVIDADEVVGGHGNSNGNGNGKINGNGNGNGNGNNPTILGAALYRLNPNYSADDLKRTDLEPESFKWLEDPEERRIAVTVVHDVMDRKMRFIREPHIQLSILFVSPEHQHKGIGGSLVNWGIQLSKQMMLPLWVESSTTAYNLYVRHGFKDQIRSKVIIGSWDIEYSILKREPDQKHQVVKSK